MHMHVHCTCMCMHRSTTALTLAILARCRATTAARPTSRPPRPPRRATCGQRWRTRPSATRCGGALEASSWQRPLGSATARPPALLGGTPPQGAWAAAHSGRATEPLRYPSGGCGCGLEAAALSPPRWNVWGRSGHRSRRCCPAARPTPCVTATCASSVQTN